jgi:hypothetical protein
MSPGLMPARSAGLPRYPATSTRRAELERISGSAVISTVPHRPRVTARFRSTAHHLFAVETGIAKPMPIDPPVWESIGVDPNQISEESMGTPPRFPD